jgi:hypothetical protein
MPVRRLKRPRRALLTIMEGLGSLRQFELGLSTSKMRA